jgi:heptosyltransferase-2
LRYCKHRFRRWLFVQFKLSTMLAIPPVYARYLQAAETLGVKDDGAGPELFWQPQHEEEANTILRQAGWQPEQELIGLAPGAGFFTKRWPVEYFAQLAGEIPRLYPEAGVAVLGGPQDAEFGRFIAARAGHHVLDLTGGSTLLVSAAVIKRCRFLVANDSGLMHVAEAVRTPLLALFGSTTRELGFYPQLPTSRVLENTALACRPCSHLGHRICPRGHFRCMREITPERVLHEIQQSWTISKH